MPRAEPQGTAPPDGAPQVLALNPGSTSTKLGLFAGERALFTESVAHADEALAVYRGRAILEQQALRASAVRQALAERGVAATALAAVVGRGGLLRPLASGTYRVDETMLADLRAARRGEHASNLGAFLAAQLAEPAGCPAFIVDPVSVDELEPVARVSGLAGIERESLSHALNTKAVAKRYAREQRRRYDELRLVVAHLGSGISVSAHRDGRMVDVNNSREEGPFSTERSGSVPLLQLVRRVLDAGGSFAEAERLVFREGGLYSYLGTRELREVLARVEAGDEPAWLVLQAMLYQVRKEVGAMAAVLAGRVDAVLLTGGMAHAGAVAAPLAEALAWIAPVHVYPGEDELQALAEGALRVLRGEEAAREYG